MLSFMLRYAFIDSMFQCLAVDFAGKVDRAFAINRIPCGWICRAAKLRFQADTRDRVRWQHADNRSRRIPCGAAGSPAYHGNICYPVLIYGDGKFWRTETYAIVAQIFFRTESATGGRCHTGRKTMFFTGCNHRDVCLLA